MTNFTDYFNYVRGKAKGTYKELVEAPNETGQYGYQNLTPGQYYLLKEMEKNPKEVEDVAVVYVADSYGYGTTSCFSGIIKKAYFETPGKLDTAMVSVHFPDYEKKKKTDKGEIFDLKLYQIEVVDEENFDIKGYSQFYQDKFINEVANRIEATVKNIDTQVKSLTTRIENARKEIKNAEVKIENYKLMKKTYAKSYFTLEELNEMIERIKKISQVEDAYISAKGNLIVLTKQLDAEKHNGEKRPEYTDLGKYMIRVSFSASQKVTVFNTVYWDGSRYHPHVQSEGHVCWGNVGSDIDAMLQEGKLVPLIQTTIGFLTYYPQDSGSPYTGYDSWYSHRSKHNKDNLVEPKII